MRDLYVRILQLVQQEKIDLIHVHSPVLNGIPALLAGRQLSLPVVYELRALWEEGKIPSGQYHATGLRAAITRGLETWLLKRVQAVTTICEGLKEEVVLRGIPAVRVQVFLNGVNTVRYRPQPTDQALKSALHLNGTFVLGFIGSFYEWEGLDLLVKSLQDLHTLLPNVRLLLVGGGEAEVRLRSLAKTLGVEGYVVFTGRVPNTAILDYYSVIDLCVYPRPKTRLTDRVTPLKPLEAMAMEKLVLASDVGGHRELIEDGVDGFLFKAGDHQDLTSKIAEVEKRISQFGHVGQNARRRVERSRNWETITLAYDLLYKNLLGMSPTKTTV
jgi:PEP-CTERM/exosortase A-associated glycosyltransferase